MSIKILKRAFDQVMAHAEETYPEECCGLLVGPEQGEKMITESVRMRNAFDGPKHDRYHINPLELAKADRESARRGLLITGIYHSHPDYPARLSAYDLNHSFPWYSYVVVSVPKGKPGDVKSWIADERRMASKEEPIEVVTEVT